MWDSLSNSCLFLTLWKTLSFTTLRRATTDTDFLLGLYIIFLRSDIEIHQFMRELKVLANCSSILRSKDLVASGTQSLKSDDHSSQPALKPKQYTSGNPFEKRGQTEIRPSQAYRWH